MEFKVKIVLCCSSVNWKSWADHLVYPNAAVFALILYMLTVSSTQSLPPAPESYTLLHHQWSLSLDGKHLNTLGCGVFLGCLDCVQIYMWSCVRGIESDSLATSGRKTEETTTYGKASENPQVACNVSKLLRFQSLLQFACSYFIIHGSNVLTALL